MPSIDLRAIKRKHISEILYVSLAALSFYLLIASRTGEARTVWEVLNPAFLPTLFVATFLLVTILLTSEKTTPKLLFVIVYSILIHSLFSIIFPAGDLSGQQMILGRTRRVFDNTAPIGWSGLPTTTVQTFVFEMFKGTNLQAALSTIFARMLSIDILYVHLSLVPVLWGVFVPVASFLVTKAIGGSDKAAVFSSLIVSAFPYTIYFGAISVPNSLGFIFFFFSLFFMLKYLSSNDSRSTYLMLAFSFFSFLAHSLTGIMSISLLLLTVVFKVYSREKKSEPRIARISLIVSFLLCVSLLPLSFLYLRLFDPSKNVVLTLDKFYELPFEEIVGLSVLGLAYSFDIKTIFLLGIGPAIAIFWMVYLLYSLKKSSMDKFGDGIQFLFGAYLIILIDYRILTLFMSGLPIYEESMRGRLSVFQGFIAAPFVALAIWTVVSSVKAFLETRVPSTRIAYGRRSLSKASIVRFFSVLLALNVLIPALLAGWTAFSLSAAYHQVAPLQTTSYELEAVKYIDENTHEKYVVIGDQWTIYAGEVIVGINNPRAYYFGEFDKTGHDLFVNMTHEPSPKWMLHAMNYTNTAAAYFIVTQPRLGTEEFNDVITKALGTLSVFRITGEGKLYIFSYRKG